MRFELEMLEQEIADLLGVTRSRISQIIGTRIQRAILADHVEHEVAHLYRDDPEYSKLLIDWIAI